MYCIECGYNLPTNSKFCSSCGKQQIEPSHQENDLGTENLDNEFLNQLNQNLEQEKFNQNLKRTIGWYLAWVFLHFFFLLALSDGPFYEGNMNGSRDFWPFGRYANFDEIEQYDITEFLFYTIFPIAFFFIRNMIRLKKSNHE